MATYNLTSGNDLITCDSDLVGSLSDGSAVDLGGSTVNGGAGIDTFRYLGGYPSGEFKLTLPAAGGYTLVATAGGASGTVTLKSIEKLKFTNVTLSLTQSSGNDLLNGNASANSLAGAAGADTLYGQGGSDTLFGGLGNDTLIGGGGNDRFVFDTKTGSSNIDKLTDFKSGYDKIVLDDDIFKALSGNAAGTPLASGSLKIVASGSAAGDANDHLIYNTTTDKLYYDADGNGASAAVQIATITLAGTAHPTAKDFLIIA